MTLCNRKKKEQLGMFHGTACHKLRKMILFKLVQETGKDICYQCGKKIKNIETLSIEHKKAWLNSENPKEKFFDLNNITFSHLNCNSASGDRTYTCTDEFKKKISITSIGRQYAWSRLDKHKVKEIKNKRNNDISDRQLGKQYNVSHTLINKIRHEKKWAHIK